MKKFNGYCISSYKSILFVMFHFWLRHMIYMHLLTWIGFGLIGYVPNKLYKVVKLHHSINIYIRLALS
jgi:hypothetical protein